MEDKDTEDSAVPDWRREVSEKARAFGEKKKLLTTPQRPLDETRQEMAEPSDPLTTQDSPESDTPLSPSSGIEPEPRMILQTPEPESSVDLAPRVRPQDWIAPEPLEKHDSVQTGKQHFLGRRTASFLIDHTIIIVLSLLLLYVCGLIIGYDSWTVIRTAWVPLLGVFLLFHFMYYAYFYKTSRQTPGQVFFNLELRHASSSYIPFLKIFVRWMAMIFLNVFNFIPLAMKDGHLLLDQLSQTEIRSLK